MKLPRRAFRGKTHVKIHVKIYEPKTRIVTLDDHRARCGLIEPACESSRDGSLRSVRLSALGEFSPGSDVIAIVSAGDLAQ